MKVYLRMLICVVLAAVALTMAVFTALGFRRANAERAGRGYVLGEMGGSVAVYAGNDPDTPLEVTDIALASLRESDRALIEAGLPAATREELLQLLEDLGG